MAIDIKKLIDIHLIKVYDEKIKKDVLIEELITLAEKNLNIGTLHSLRESIIKKEEVANNMTAIGNNLAIPHGIFFDYSYEKDMFLIIAQIRKGVKGYDSPFDDKKTKYVFLIAYNQDTYCTKRTEVLPIIARYFSEPKNIDDLNRRVTPQEIYDLLMSEL